MTKERAREIVMAARANALVIDIDIAVDAILAACAEERTACAELARDQTGEFDDRTAQHMAENIATAIERMNP